ASNRRHDPPSDRHLDWQTDFHVRCISLRNIDKHAQGANLRNFEEAVRSAGNTGRRRTYVVCWAPCGNKGADIKVPLDHPTVERGDDALERCQLLEPLDIGFV